MSEISIDQPDFNTEQALSLLERGRIDSLLGLLPWGSNHTFLVTVSTDEHTALAVYKPRRAERPLGRAPRGPLSHRERAACLVSEALGWGTVRATALRGGPERRGRVRWLVPQDPEQNHSRFGSGYVGEGRRIALS